MSLLIVSNLTRSQDSPTLIGSMVKARREEALEAIQIMVFLSSRLKMR
jgi:hypothetical protein